MFKLSRLSSTEITVYPPGHHHMIRRQLNLAFPQWALLGSFEFGAYLGLDISSEYKYVVCLLFFWLILCLKRAW